MTQNDPAGGTGRPPCSQAEIVRQLAALGVPPGSILLVHTSFRAIGPVHGGPPGLIQALRDAVGPEGTLVMPSWPATADEPFDTAATPCDPDLGVVPQTFWQLPGVRRSDHFHAFAAAGPAADRILRDPLPLPPHIPESPVGRVHQLDGLILLLGVNHDADTTIHLAEVMARVPYGVPKSGVVVEHGRVARVEYRENDHCCSLFKLADDWLRSEGCQAEGVVGHGRARLISSQELVRVVTKRLEDEPLIFLHRHDQGCSECDEARASVLR